MSAPLPPIIEKYLTGYLRRRRFFALVHSISLAIVVAVAWTLASCLIDRLLALPATTRLVLLCVNLFLTVTLAARPIARWIFRKSNWNTVAAEIERRDQRFEQLLQTVVSQSLAAPDRRGSAQLLDHLQSDLATRLESIRPASLHSFRPLLFNITVAAAVVASGASLTRLAWLDLPRLLHRYTNPFARISPATTTHLDITPGDADIIAGQPLTVRAAVTGQGDSPVTLHATESTAVQHFTMAPASGGFTFTFPNVDRDFRYYVTSGDATSTTYDVRALSRPAVASYEIRYDYPPGLYKAPTTTSNMTGLLEAPAGTRAHLAMHLTEPFTRAQLAIAGGVIDSTGGADSLLRRAGLLLDHDATYEVRLLSRHNIANRVTGLPIRILPDNAPTVRLLQPAADLAMSPWEMLTITAAGEDDYGLAKLSVVVAAHGVQKELPLPLKDHPLRAQSSITLDLSELNLNAGDAVTLTPSASDGTGHTTIGHPVTILIAHSSIDPAARQRAAELSRAAEQSQSLLTAVQQARQSFDAARAINPAEGLRASIARAEARRQLAAAAQTAGSVRLSLERVIARSSSSSLSIGLLCLIDDAAYTAGALEAAAHVLETNNADTNWSRDRVERATARATDLRDAVKVLSRAQLATLLDAQTADLAGLPAGAATRPATAALLSQATATASQIGIDATDTNARRGIIADAMKLLAQLRPVDFTPGAEEFSRELPLTATNLPFFPERLEVAAQSESLRSDAELVRAADLQLAARAASAGARLPPGAPLEHFKQAFPHAIRALTREHDARRAGTFPPDWGAIAAAGEAARQSLRELAPSAGASATDHTLAANAQLAARPPKATTQAGATPVPPAAVEAARLAAQQDQLREKPGADSAKTQTAVAEQIEKLRRERESSRAADHRAEQARALSQADDAAERLWRQIAQLRQAAERSRDLSQRAQRAQSAAATATPQSIQPAEELSQDLAGRAAQAGKDLATAKSAVTPGESQKIAAALQNFSPSSSTAAMILKLSNAMTSAAQFAGGEREAESIAADRARQAADTVRETLAHALDQLTDQDPLAVAAAAASMAEQAIKSNSPTAASAQLRAGSALSRSREQFVHSAAAEGVAKLPGVSAILSPFNPPELSASQWTLTSATPSNSHATATSTIAPEYQDAIRAYFQAVAKKP
jgi:hypothetical protein